MATLQQFESAISRIDTATTSAGAVLRNLRDRVATLETQAGISADDEASVLGRLDSVASALEQMGRSPENPVPVEPAPVSTAPSVPGTPAPETGTETGTAPSEPTEPTV